MNIIHKIHSDMQMCITSDKIYIETNTNVLVIDRISDTISLKANKSNNLHMNFQKIYGIIGIINLIAGPYLIVITKANIISKIGGHDIYQIVETDIILFKKTTTHLTDNQINFNSTYINMIKSVLNIPFFYFSYTYDISHSLQFLYNDLPNYLNFSMYERADKNFFWNFFLLSKLAQNKELLSFCLPIIHGFISSKSFYLNEKSVQLTIISRRSVKRAGTRYFCRGADSNGNVANYVETEQIIEIGDAKCSYVQIRGSIPLIWNQYPNLKYKPQPQLNTAYNHLEIFQKHINKIQKKYKKLLVINLINHKGQELVLEKELTSTINFIKKTNKMIQYESFDFHHECKQNRWDRLNILIEHILTDLNEIGYFLVNSKGSILKLQTGVVRTNCIDSLDRTNVVQGLIAKKNLEKVLVEFNVMLAGESIYSHPNIDFIYRNVWADNADYCSIQYAGTPALKTDFTRTGKRTILGNIRDGYNSIIRYYKNNFSDGTKQDAIDLFLGNYIIKENEGKSLKCPLDEHKDWKYLTLPTFLLGSLSMFFLSIILPREFTTETFLYIMFWSGMFSSTGLMILYYGQEFINFPRLNDNIYLKSKKSTE